MQQVETTWPEAPPAPAPDGVAGEARWALAGIRADIEQRKAEGTLTSEEELEIVLESLYLINRMHEDADDLHRAQKLFWQAGALPLEERILKLWEAMAIFIP